MDLNNGNDLNNPPVMVVRGRIMNEIKRWRESDKNHYQWLFISSPLNRLEAIFVAGNLRRYLPLEGSSGNGNKPQTMVWLLYHGDEIGEDFSDEAVDVFCGFLQETPCHLVTLRLEDFQSQQFRQLLEAIHTNTSIKKLELGGLHESDGALVEDLLRHKTDLTDLQFTCCRPSSIFDSRTGLLPSGLMRLKVLGFFKCQVDDEAVRVILQHKYNLITELHLYDSQITSDGLGIMARRIREALPSLEILSLDHNSTLLNNPENTRLFTQLVLPMLKELRISNCGQDYTGYSQIIKACEAETIHKLEFLDITQSHQASASQLLRNQLVESLPKMRVKRLCGVSTFFTHTDRALLSAFYKNMTIIELLDAKEIDEETNRRHIAPILRRNLHSWQAYGLLRPPAAATTTTITHPPFFPPRGLWPRVLATVGQGIQGSTPVFEILLDRLACWIKLDDTVRKALAAFDREQLVEMVVFRNEQIEQLEQKIEQQAATMATFRKLAMIGAVLNVVVAVHVLGSSWKACRK